VVSRERLRDVVDDARYEPGFRDAEQIAHHVELLGRRDERGQRRNDRPRQDDAREPALRADPLQDHVARHLEHDVAQRERTCAEAEHRVAETQIDHHLQFREADVDAVDVGGHVREHEDRQDAQRKMPRNARFPRRVVRVAAVDRMIGRARRVQIQEVPPLLCENGCVNLSMAMPPVVDVECQQQFRCPRHDAQPRVRVVRVGNEAQPGTGCEWKNGDLARDPATRPQRSIGVGEGMFSRSSKWRTRRRRPNRWERRRAIRTRPRILPDRIGASALSAVASIRAVEGARTR
jgi:hypothetical protein